MDCELNRLQTVRRAFAPRASQRGVVLFIALIVMVAMSLAAIALIRSIDTTNAVIGNLAFRLASILPANGSVEQAAAALFPDADIGHVTHIADKNNDLTVENYFASRQAGEVQGVPAVLQKKTTALALSKHFSDPNGMEVAYVIERMCLAAGPATNGNCDLVPPKQNPGETINLPYGTPLKLPSVPFYRVTIRVDGPKNTTSFVQAMLK